MHQKMKKRHGRQEGGEKYSSSYGTVDRLREADGTGTAAGLESLAETEMGFATPSQMPVV